jgi:hypothetical protein
MGKALWSNEEAYSVVSGLSWHTVVIVSALAYELIFYFRTSERSIANLSRVFALIFKLALIAFQSWRLWRGEIQNASARTVARLSIAVLLLFSVIDVVGMSIVDIPKTAVIAVAITAALLHLLAAATERRARMDALRRVRTKAGVGWLSAGLDAAVVGSSFLWAAAAVAAETQERGLELALLILLGVCAVVVLFGTVVLARMLEGVAQRGELETSVTLPALHFRA